MKPTQFGIRLIRPILFVTLLLAGCSQSPVVKYYTLSSLPKPLNAPAPDRSLAIGVGPITFPRLLERPQIITRLGPHRVEINEFHRWAGSLPADFSARLADNLGSLLGTAQVAVHPWEDSFKPSFQVRLDVTRFDGAPGEEVTLEGTWTLSGLDPHPTTLTRKTSIKKPVPGTDFEALVAAHSQAISALAQEIAEAVRKWR